MFVLTLVLPSRFLRCREDSVRTKLYNIHFSESFGFISSMTFCSCEGNTHKTESKNHFVKIRFVYFNLFKNYIEYPRFQLSLHCQSSISHFFSLRQLLQNKNCILIKHIFRYGELMQLCQTNLRTD